MPLNEEFDALPQNLKDVVMNPEFQSVVAEIQSLPASERSQAIATQLTPEALATRGIPIPEGFTITTHASLGSFLKDPGNIHFAGKLTALGIKICIPNRIGNDVCFP